MTNPRRYHIRGVGEDFEIGFLTKNGWVKSFNHRGLYSLARARREIRQIQIRNQRLDINERIIPLLEPELEVIK